MTKPRFVYRESIPESSLSPFVTRIYELRSIVDDEETIEGAVLDAGDPLLLRLLPNPDVNLTFDLEQCGDGESSLPLHRLHGRSVVVGAMSEPIPVVFGSRVHAFGVAFEVGRSAPILPVPPRELADRIVSLTEVWGDEARALESQLRCLDSFQERTAFVSGALNRRAPDRSTDDSELQDIIAHTRTHNGEVRVDRLAAETGLARQSFTRWFTDRVGMGPKRFIRLARVNALLTFVLTGPLDRWADVAGRFGYYDEAHMIAEFTWFTGMSPKRLLKARALKDQRSEDGGQGNLKMR